MTKYMLSLATNHVTLTLWWQPWPMAIFCTRLHLLYLLMMKLFINWYESLFYSEFEENCFYFLFWQFDHHVGRHCSTVKKNILSKSLNVLDLVAFDFDIPIFSHSRPHLPAKRDVFQYWILQNRNSISGLTPSISSARQG